MGIPARRSVPGATPVQDALHAVFPFACFRAEGVDDALVGGISLTVNAVGVDLEQDRDAMPGAAGDLGGRYPGVQP
jgi:hypothetical protein